DIDRRVKADAAGAGDAGTNIEVVSAAVEIEGRAAEDSEIAVVVAVALQAEAAAGDADGAVVVEDHLKPARPRAAGLGEHTGVVEGAAAAAVEYLGIVLQVPDGAG